MELPALRKGKVAAPLKRVVVNTARAMGVSDQTAFIFLSHFCEQIAREVAMDNVVSIPAFGAFGPVNWTPRNGISPDVATPRFHPSKVFKSEVANCCTPFPKSEKRFETYASNHRRRGQSSASVHGAMARFRREMAQQAISAGVDVSDHGS